jgi:hypothetical protein
MISIQKKFPENPIIVIYNALSYVQQWRIMMKPVKKRLVLELTKQIIEHANQFVPISVRLSDVGFYVNIWVLIVTSQCCNLEYMALLFYAISIKTGMWSFL